ncbi:pentapeptide repeat-containing protein [Actinomycetospora sp. CA-084318]|uniref:pentapeptide repeat-containing protein n=1 Tax=Actinomycetospora sp. CA-084318 TaxID=3239892 RepID=UPI003D98551F
MKPASLHFKVGRRHVQLLGGGAFGLAGLGSVLALAILLAGWAWIKVPDLYPPYVAPIGAPPLTPEVAASRDATRAQAVVTTRASVLAALAGLGALITIAINYRNFLLNARTLATTQETFRVAERGHLTDRYSKAIEQLGHESIAIRLGGIYALQQLAVDTGRDSDQATVVEVLSAFVRLNLRDGAIAKSDGPATAAAPHRVDNGRDSRTSIEPRADVLAAISVLAQLLVRGDVVDRAHFNGLDFGGLDLSNCRLAGGSLTRVTLKDVDLFGADLTDIDLTRADLARADLARADLAFANLAGANLSGADLLDAKLTDATLIDTRLTGTRLMRASLVRAELGNADLTRAFLVGADLTEADLRDAKLNCANLTDADLTDAIFTGADITGATVRAVQLSVSIGAPLWSAADTCASETDPA